MAPRLLILRLLRVQSSSDLIEIIDPDFEALSEPDAEVLVDA